MDTLIVLEVLKDSVLDMTSDVKGAENYLTYPYMVTLQTRASWKEANEEKVWLTGNPNTLRQSGHSFGYQVNSKLVRKCTLVLDKLASWNTIMLSWVPGH